MWIQLKSSKAFPVQGIMTRFHPGDWVDVGKQTARHWIADGAAWDPNAKMGEDFPEESGMLIINSGNVLVSPPKACSLSTQTGLTPFMPWERTLIWNSACPLQPSTVAVGLGLLDVWDIAMPLWDYKVLAQNVGTEADQARTKRIVRDLRVPLYETRIIFIKKCKTTENLLETWLDEGEEGGDTRLAFLRAFYQVKPLMLALPVTWGHSREAANL